MDWKPTEADRVRTIAPEVTLLRGFAQPTAELESLIDAIAGRAPFRHLATRGGGRMSVAMTNCGPWGWHSDAAGYRYVECDPLSGAPWPSLPPAFLQLAAAAAQQGGFAGFVPDACLLNRYEPGAQMGTHRDFDELDLRHPIVSVSIGLPATFLWYGAQRTGSPLRVPLFDGDVVVWGGSARAGYHAVRRLAPPAAPDLLDALGTPVPMPGGTAPAGATALRYNLTFRRAK
jgi:alkylated DNA repair protein (DNA oxidative demethylase)